MRARPSFARVMHLNSQSSSVRVLKSQKGLSLASRYPLNRFTTKLLRATAALLRVFVYVEIAF